MLLAQFNQADRTDAEAALRPCLDIQRWIDEVVDARPFGSVAELQSAAADAAQPFTADEVEAALAHHPRIGERAAGNTAEARFSQKEQQSLGEADAETMAALAAGNVEYEKKFGQVFLIRAAGRSKPEILAALQERLGHTPEQEEPIIQEQLRQIALLRLEGVVSE
ncbi:2-oxo-4-hydroxy-4-carboxy-5-ureidoimidazoline decarboxylase [Pseudarthrobacter sp. J75]|uniref:2-oxo-4-hydroxy-4-carboxy-5-ureidoimidazoline decarboxylase n=1 Tax=unclassified Pseudarthrobacter TaxID=2647000 RepID=UPI002E80EBBE|nr:MULTISPECIES: 2-oxo-4-hydroxy-4-carboxy-5-ureidoimidazoline decarboxylase [unclassified Pseudarthrobacter]MEE2522056.1 2-oxo-4-hydroxy-4-carboxy-5-ureidoimidazoline decarboxylase [Pseudarthrobacter sp. J47]MEE2528981.1 2-oxo-4-hydroxy-4-carboxy-5-ureidoimidazoline decarboxylase [Pseudarthrobacter sp. J75]